MSNNWLSIQEVADLTGWHLQYVRRLAREGQLRHRPSELVRSDGRPQREYALSSLPVEAQLKFLKQPMLAGPAVTALALRTNPNQSNLFASLPEVTEPRAPQLVSRAERPGMEAPGGDCAARGIRHSSPAIPTDVSHHGRSRSAKHELAG